MSNIGSKTPETWKMAQLYKNVSPDRREVGLLHEGGVTRSTKTPRNSIRGHVETSGKETLGGRGRFIDEKTLVVVKGFSRSSRE